MTWDSETRLGADPLRNLILPNTARRIGTWNARTLYETERAAQAAREMDRCGLEIVELSEVQLTTSGQVTLASGHLLLFSGPRNEDDDLRNGVGKAKKSLMEWEPVSERILTARCHSKFQKVAIVQCYAPTNLAQQEVKEDFYDYLLSVLEKAPKRDITVLMGNMNAKVGCDNSGREFTMGKECKMIERGELFADFWKHGNPQI